MVSPVIAKKKKKKSVSRDLKIIASNVIFFKIIVSNVFAKDKKCVSHYW